jgi:predicted metalloprotease with PDZ domain
MENAKQIAGLDSKITNGMYTFDSFHSLADSPFIVSADLQHQTYHSNGIQFHIWFQGIVKPDWKKVISDFQKFTDFQINAFGKFPSDEYHFLFQITPYKAYHGVEHITSTVLLLGPSYDLFDTLYTELLGLCSHELYHAWNVKAIRPTEMRPYNYASENYFQTGFVAEGVTTYLGDRILFECGVFDREQYTKELNAYVHKHFHNDGRKYYSVAASSFDTWLDGYEPGIPGRKTSIYTEGCLIAYICDMRIQRSTEKKSNLHSVMRFLYEQTTVKEGYTAEQYQQLLEKVAGVSFDDIFQQLVYSTNDYEPFLIEALQFDGYTFGKKTMKGLDQYGIKVQNTMEGVEITNILEGSAAYLSGLVEGDKIIAVNDVVVTNNLTSWVNFFTDEENDLFVTINRKGILDQWAVLAPNDVQYFAYELKVK